MAGPTLRFGSWAPITAAEPAPEQNPLPAEVAEVAARHQPDEPGYGQTAWNEKTKTVLWISWDGTSLDEQRAAEADFLAIPGVESVEVEAESLPTGWWDAEVVYPDNPPRWVVEKPDEAAALQEIVALALGPLRFEFDPDQARGPDGKWIGEGKGDEPAGQSDQAAQFDSLKGRWAELDRSLLPYAGQPRNPEAVKIIDQQLDTVREMHALNVDQGKGGVGLPGGARDVVIVGAGPAGLQAAINGGTEGLDTLMVDQNTEPGGQVGLSSRVENVLGFPAGVTGEQLAQSGLEQAQRVGADTKLGVGVTGLSYDPATGLKTLTFSDGSTVDARSVVMAGGVQFNTLSFPGADSKGVVYGDSRALKDLSKDGNCVIVGAGNSAGQAAVDVASSAQNVTMVVRGDSLGSMSPYLVDQLETDPHVAIRYGAEVTAATPTADGALQAVTLNDGTVLPTQSLGVFVGSAPRTDWASAVNRDERGYVRTGSGGSPLETNIPGVYAAGDVRSGSQHRVIAAAGEGGLAIASAWQYVTKTFGPANQGKAAAVTVSVWANAKKRDPGDAFLAKVQELDRQEPFTGFDPTKEVAL